MTETSQTTALLCMSINHELDQLNIPVNDGVMDASSFPSGCVTLSWYAEGTDITLTRHEATDFLKWLWTLTDKRFSFLNNQSLVFNKACQFANEAGRVAKRR